MPRVGGLLSIDPFLVGNTNQNAVPDERGSAGMLSDLVNNLSDANVNRVQLDSLFFMSMYSSQLPLDRLTSYPSFMIPYPGLRVREEKKKKKKKKEETNGCVGRLKGGTWDMD